MLPSEILKKLIMFCDTPSYLKFPFVSKHFYSLWDYNKKICRKRLRKMLDIERAIYLGSPCDYMHEIVLWLTDISIVRAILFRGDILLYRIKRKHAKLFDYEKSFDFDKTMTIFTNLSYKEDEKAFVLMMNLYLAVINGDMKAIETMKSNVIASLDVITMIVANILAKNYNNYEIGIFMLNEFVIPIIIDEKTSNANITRRVVSAINSAVILESVECIRKVFERIDGMALDPLQYSLMFNLAYYDVSFFIKQKEETYNLIKFLKTKGYYEDFLSVIFSFPPGGLNPDFICCGWKEILQVAKLFALRSENQKNINLHDVHTICLIAHDIEENKYIPTTPKFLDHYGIFAEGSTEYRSRSKKRLMHLLHLIGHPKYKRKHRFDILRFLYKHCTELEVDQKNMKLQVRRDYECVIIEEKTLE